jgi:drug/metabolite transporter (DMT)-like permease
MRRSLGLPVIFALAAVWIIWGSTYLAIKIGLETIPPFAMQGFRFAIAGALLYTFLRVRGVASPTRRQWWAAARVGALLLIGGIGLVSVAEDWGIGTGLVATLIAIQPMMMSLANGVLGTWPHGREWTGMGIGLVGVLVLMGDSGLSGSLGGIGLVMIASVTWTAGSLISKRIDLPKGAMASAAEMLCAAPGFAVLAALKGEELHAPSLRSATALAYLVVVGSIIAFSAYLFLLGRVRPALAVSYAYVNPIIAVVLGAVFADEVISANMAVAMPLVLLGVVLVTFAARPVPHAAPEHAQIDGWDEPRPESVHAVPASVD